MNLHWNTFLLVAAPCYVLQMNTQNGHLRIENVALI